MLVTTPVNAARVKLGAQVVQVLVKQGFTGPKKWESVILVGTKADRAEPGDIECFAADVVPLFFEEAGGQGASAVVHQGDYSALHAAVQKLPSVAIAYEPPDPTEMGKALGEKLGVDPSVFAAELTTARRAMEEAVAQMRQQHEQAMRAAQQRNRELEARVERAALDIPLCADRLSHPHACG